MADTVSTLVAEVQSVVDVTADQALTALNRRHRVMVARSKCLRRVFSTSVAAGQATYYLPTAPEIIQLYQLKVGGVPYSPGRFGDLYAGAQGTLTLSGPGGVYVRYDPAAGEPQLRFYPAPSEATYVELAAAVLPTDLTTDGGLAVDSDFYDALVDGATATFLRREGEGDPASLEARFDQACEELRRRVATKYRSGPAQIRLQGVNA